MAARTAGTMATTNRLGPTNRATLVMLAAVMHVLQFLVRRLTLARMLPMVSALLLLVPMESALVVVVGVVVVAAVLVRLQGTCLNHSTAGPRLRAVMPRPGPVH